MTRKNNRQKKYRQQLRKQKLAALALIILSIVTIPMADGDATFTLFAIPVGLGLLFTKEVWFR